jgi:hypothetical protein
LYHFALFDTQNKSKVHLHYFQKKHRERINPAYINQSTVMRKEGNYIRLDNWLYFQNLSWAQNSEP